MTKREITLTCEDEKLEALEYALRKDRTTVQKQMDEALRQLYETKVPEAVRDYLDNKGRPAAPKRPTRHAKSSAPSDPKQDRETPEGESPGGETEGTHSSGAASPGVPGSSSNRTS